MGYKQFLTHIVLCLGLVSSVQLCHAQDDAGPPPGLSELHDARDQVYQEMLVIQDTAILLGAVFGLIGGIRVYTNWQLGQQRIDVQIIGWLGACIFLEIMAVFVDALFGG